MRRGLGRLWAVRGHSATATNDRSPPLWSCRPLFGPAKTRITKIPDKSRGWKTLA